MSEGTGGTADNNPREKEGLDRERELHERRQRLSDDLRAQGKGEFVDNLEELRALRDRESLSEEEREQRDSLAKSLSEAAEEDDVIKDLLTTYIEEELPKSNIKDEEILQDPTNDEIKTFEEETKKMQDAMLGLTAETDPEKAAEQFDIVRRQVGDIASSKEMAKIKKSHSALAKVAYGSWMSFLMVFGIFLLTTHFVSKAAGGGGKR